MTKELLALKKQLKVLAKKKGRHTELITVYVADGYNLDKVTARLSEEQGTASNIKSSATRKNVTTALTKILQHLKLFKRRPKNGLAIFCGNVSEQEGREDFLMESITPPKPLGLNLYRCSQKFVLDPLYEMLEEKETYGIILIERQHADVVLLKGKRTEIVANFDSLIPGKFRAGGQSAQRFERVREGMAKDFYRKVAENATKVFNDIKDLKGILVGGPGPTKDEFLDEGNLPTDLKKKVIGILDIGYTGETGIDELLKKAEDVLAEAEITKEKQLIERFMGEVAKDLGLATYGEEEVRAALSAGAVEIVLISEAIEKKRVHLKCTSCDHERDETVEDAAELTCSICGAPMELMKEEELVEELEALAKDIGARVELISIETKEGQQLLNLGGIAAILRFKSSA